MKEVDVSRYETLLLAKRAEIVGNSRRREDIWIVQSNEQVEAVQLAGEREFAVCALERDSKIVMQIGAALERIGNGEFGVCLDCDEPISPKRLAVIPWTAYCLRCQELHDGQEAAGTAERQLAA